MLGRDLPITADSKPTADLEYLTGSRTGEYLTERRPKCHTGSRPIVLDWKPNQMTIQTVDQEYLRGSRTRGTDRPKRTWQEVVRKSTRQEAYRDYLPGSRLRVLDRKPTMSN